VSWIRKKGGMQGKRGKGEFCSSCYSVQHKSIIHAPEKGRYHLGKVLGKRRGRQAAGGDCRKKKNAVGEGKEKPKGPSLTQLVTGRGAEKKGS